MATEHKQTEDKMKAMEEKLKAKEKQLEAMSIQGGQMDNAQRGEAQDRSAYTVEKID